MALFGGGNKRLPATTYGYQPPAGATASGAVCSNPNCTAVTEPGPKKWPFNCPQCGAVADPNFDQPWYEDARGFELERRIRTQGDEYGVYTYFLYDWKFGQAFRYGNADPRAVLNEALQWRQQWNAAHESQKEDPRKDMVWRAINYDQWQLADEMLAGLLQNLDYENKDFREVDESGNRGNQLRTTYLTLVSALLYTLDSPNGRSLPHAREFDKAVRYIGQATQHAMGATDTKHRWQMHMRTTPL